MTWEALSDWVDDVDKFLAECWRTAPAIFRPAGRLSTPISLSDVDAALTGGLLRTPYLEMVRKSTPIDEHTYTTTRTVDGVAADGFVEPTGVRSLLDDGVTLLLRNIEHWHEPTRALAWHLEGDLGRRVEAFLFVTPPGQQGLPVHRDDADVLLLQINGSKHWKVYGGPTTAEWTPGRAGNVGAALLEETIRENEVLYVPRGFAHEAIGGPDLSVHLSLTIREVSAQDLQTALYSLLVEDLSLTRRPITDDALLDDAAELLHRFRTGLEEITARDVLASARAAKLDPHNSPISTLADMEST
jgi:hypothetical protein